MISTANHIQIQNTRIKKRQYWKRTVMIIGIEPPRIVRNEIDKGVVQRRLVQS